MKKVVSVFLVFALLLLSGPIQINAADEIENESITFYPTAENVDTLFRIRAQLLLDPSTTQDQLDKIDEQLLQLGVEKISPSEVAQKFGNTAQPMYDVESTEDTEWFSERIITVIRGVQYETQIITGQWKNRDSLLCEYTTGVYRQYSGKMLGVVNAVQVLADKVTTGAIAEKIPIIGDALTVATTLYDVYKAYDDSVTPLTIIDDAEFSFDILMGTTVKLVYAKLVGSPDDPYQVEVYKGNEVNYQVYIHTPIFEVQNGEQIMTLHTQCYSDSSKSYAYDTEDCINFALENYLGYRAGSTNMDYQQEIRTIPIVLLDETYTAIVPTTHP